MNTSYKQCTYRKHWGRRKHLANPLPDVICIVALTLILLLTGNIHIPIPV